MRFNGEQALFYKLFGVFYESTSLTDKGQFAE